MAVPGTLSTSSPVAVTVAWRTVFVAGAPSGQADPDTDYLPASRTLTLPPGVNSSSVTIDIKSDTSVEGNEYVVVQFGNPTNAYMGDFWGLGFAGILNDDSAP